MLQVEPSYADKKMTTQTHYNLLNCLKKKSKQQCDLLPQAAHSLKNWQGGRPLLTEILPPSDLPSPVNGILWEMSELITQEGIAIGISNLVEGWTT